ncbi:MAG: hypothetical protein GYB32_02270 [Algicola sp.]|nr:hypothetical protein [Algicola sp.]
MHFIEKISVLAINYKTYIKLVIPNFYIPMQTYTTNELSCSVFGHNLECSTMSHQKRFTCKTCQAIVHVDDHGNFDSFPIHNHDIKTAIKQLFVLSHQYWRKQISF